MRSLYKQIGPNIAIQQGVIINGCIADKSKENVAGIIITPRCDIGNGGKVSTIHYLPVIAINDWLKQYILPDALSVEKEKLAKLLTEQKISSHILDIIKEQDISQLMLRDQNLQNKITSYVQARDGLNYGDSIKSYIKTQLGLLIANNHSRYYLIEDWDKQSVNKHYIIILREIKRMTLDFVMMYTNGFQSKLLNENLAKENDVAVVPYSFNYQTLCEVGSPYIEHILQQFSYNFCRIGVEELDRNKVKESYDIEKIINQ